MANFSVRAAEPEDAGTLAGMLPRLLGIERVSEERLHEALSHRQKRKDPILFGAIAEGPTGGILGYTLFQLCFSVPSMDYYLQVDIFFVRDVPYREMVAVELQLLRYIRRVAEELGAEWLEVFYRDVSPGLRRTLELLGGVTSHVRSIRLRASSIPPATAPVPRTVEG